MRFEVLHGDAHEVARVFPRKTKATPTDALAFIGEPPLFLPDVDEVYVSVTFTWDLVQAQRLAEAWGHYFPTRIGGPATGMREEEFTPGMYLKPGYVITSRGCPNRCWFCEVWRRNGDIRELPITDGWNIQDDNLLACSETHIRAVFEMLKRQPHRAIFSGGLEAKRLEDWHVDLLANLNPKQIFFAYDMPNDLDPLIRAGRMLQEVGFSINSRQLYCYVLIGYPGDTFEAAESRCWQAVEAGFIPFTMLYRDHQGKFDRTWRRLQRSWCRPAAVMSQIQGRG